MNEIKTQVTIEGLRARRGGRKDYRRPVITKQAELARIVAGATGKTVHQIGN